MTDEDLKHAASVLCRCQYLEPDALVMHRMKTMEAWESRVPFVKAVLSALADNLPDTMVDAAVTVYHADDPSVLEEEGNQWLTDNMRLALAALAAEGGA